MTSISVLDCTLRDGGYCNHWNFGKDNIIKCIEYLTSSEIDIIECGFVSEKSPCNPDYSKYRTIEEISDYLPKNHRKSMYVVMINYGEYDIDQIPPYSDGIIDGIRIAFHKKNMLKALEYCKKVKDKGYKVFVQAMVSMTYSDLEFIDLISEVNKLSPYAFYIVDSFGMMKKNDILRYYSLVLNNLHDTITIGFHSHNNMQLAYSNAITILEMRSGRELIFDSSVYGMGRGAGNLNTELFIDYLNKEYNTSYDLKPILTMMDDVINDFYQKTPWGYSLSNYLSAVHSAHPNYADYFSRKNTMTIELMNTIFTYMDGDKKVEYSESYAEELYLKIMNLDKNREGHISELKKVLDGKTVLLIAPGKNSRICKEKIIEIIKLKDIICISVNHNYDYCKTDYIFVSNNRRFRNFSQLLKSKCITTTNIVDENSFAQIKYSDLINEDKAVFDNGGLMAIKMLINFGAMKVLLAGFDGYELNETNYADDRLSQLMNKEMIDATNVGMKKQIKCYSRLINIDFITESKYCDK